jgi:hypothetical protein
MVINQAIGSIIDGLILVAVRLAGCYLSWRGQGAEAFQ